jgi:hypothetical protein
VAEKVKKTKVVPTIDSGAQFNEGPVQEPEEESVAEGMNMVRIKIPVMLKIKRQVYNPGFHVVPSHLARMMSEMVDKKRRADMSVFVGKNILVERMMDRTLVQTEVENLDIKKLVNR